MESDLTQLSSYQKQKTPNHIKHGTLGNISIAKIHTYVLVEKYLSESLMTKASEIVIQTQYLNPVVNP